MSSDGVDPRRPEIVDGQHVVGGQVPRRGVDRDASGPSSRQSETAQDRERDEQQPDDESDVELGQPVREAPPRERREGASSGADPGASAAAPDSVL